MKVRVTKRLNVRDGIPSVDSDKLGVYEVGNELEVIGVRKGQNINGVDTWFDLEGGKRVWSGGTTDHKGQSNGAVNNAGANYRKLVSSIPEPWLLINKVSCKIGIMDSSFDEYIVSQSKYTSSYPSGFKSNGNPHGACCASLIAGSFQSNDDFVGIIPNATIASIGIYDSDNYVSYETISRAFEQAVIDNVKIINYSIGDWAVDERRKKLQNKVMPFILKALAAGIAVVAAGGDNNDLYNELPFPANVEGVISVGHVSPQFVLDNAKYQKYSRDFYLVHDDLIGLNNSGDKISFGGCSASTALITGVLALGVEANGSAPQALLELKKTINNGSVGNLITIK